MFNIFQCFQRILAARGRIPRQSTPPSKHTFIKAWLFETNLCKNDLSPRRENEPFRRPTIAKTQFLETSPGQSPRLSTGQSPPLALTKRKIESSQKRAFVKAASVTKVSVIAKASPLKTRLHQNEPSSTLNHQLSMNSSLPAPQSGQIHSSGNASNSVPGEMPPSGSPAAGSYSYPQP